MRSLLVVVLVAVLAGCSSKTPPAEGEAIGAIEGWVLDDVFRPVAGADVQVHGLGNATTDDEGHFRIEAPLNKTSYLVSASRPGYAPSTASIEIARPDQVVEVRLLLAAIADTAYSRLEHLSGSILCEIVAQVGHSHGSGGPEEDDRTGCSNAPEARQFTITPDADPTDILVEAVWEPGNPRATHMALSLHGDELLAFAEGRSALRFEVASAIVQDHFSRADSADIRVWVGIPEDAPGELFLGAFIDQSFELFVTTYYGMPMPREASAVVLT